MLAADEQNTAVAQFFYVWISVLNLFIVSVFWSFLLTLVPLVMVAGFFGLAVMNTFWVLAVVFVARRVGEYAFIRPGREMLFSRVETGSKYKAKNLIDVPVYRGGDALSAQVKTALEAGGMASAGVALLGAALAALWALNGWWLGRQARLKEPSSGRG